MSHWQLSRFQSHFWFISVLLFFGSCRLGVPWTSDHSVALALTPLLDWLLLVILLLDDWNSLVLGLLSIETWFVLGFTSSIGLLDCGDQVHHWKAFPVPPPVYTRPLPNVHFSYPPPPSPLECEIRHRSAPTLSESTLQIGPGYSLESWAVAELLFLWDVPSKKGNFPYHFWNTIWDLSGHHEP